MARSLLNQFTQTRGSIVYDDTMSTALSEVAGREKTAGLTLSINGTTVTITAGGNFEDSDEGNILVIGGVAYEITAVNSTTECVVDSAPGDGSSISADLHYYQNLEDDLNYIRSRLKEITGETTWSGANSDTLISLRDAITGADSFLELNDVDVGSYTDGNMLYTTTTGVSDTAVVKFEPITGTFYVTDNGTISPTDGLVFGPYDGGALGVSFGGEGLLALDAGGFQTGETTFKPAYFEVDITNKDIELHAHNNVTTTISGTDQLTVDANGISLASGESVNNIVASITEPGSDDNLVTEQGIVEFVTAVSGVLNSSIVGQDEFIELSDVYVDSYAADNMLYTSSSGVHDTSDMTYDPDTGDIRIGGTSAPRFVTDVAAATAIMYGDNDTFIAISGTGGSFAAYDNSTLIFSMTDTFQSLGVTSDTYMTVDQDNDDIEFGAAGTAEVTISTAGLALKSGADVNNIVTSISAPGSDDNLATEQAIVEYVNTVSGSMVHNELEGLQGGTTDEYYHMTANEDAAISSDGTDFTIGQNLIAGGNVTVSGTFGFDTGTTVNEISTAMDATGGDDDTLLTEAAIYNWVNTVSGSLQSDVIWEIVDTPTTQIRPKAEHLDKAIYTEGNVTIGGNLTVTGTLFYTDTETVQAADNIIHINYGEAGAGVTAGEAGIQVDRGSETDYQFLFDEGTDTFRIGVSGTQNSFNTTYLQPVATREDSPIDTRVAWWDADDYTFRTQGDTYITVNSGTGDIYMYHGGNVGLWLDGSNGRQFFGDQSDTYVMTDQNPGAVEFRVDNTQIFFGNVTVQRMGISTDTNIHMNQGNDEIIFTAANTAEATIDTDGLSLKAGASVNEIVDSTGDLSAASTDDQLATAKLIYNELQEVTTGSGVVDHNLLANLQGGNGSDEYYHLNAAAHTALSGVDSTDVSNWDTAYGWGDHSAAGYLTSESDPVFTASAAAGITSGDISDWDGAVSDLTTVSGYVHEHYDKDLTWGGGGSVWTLTDASISDAVPDNLTVYLNGLKNKANDEDYYTATASGTTLTVTFAYDTFDTDWANVEYTVTIY